MSNSIWKTPDIKPDNDNDIVCLVGALPFAGYYEKFNASYVEHTTGENYTSDEIDRWCYLDELLTQVDKAERLQKAVDNSREKLAAFMHDVWGNWFAYQLNNSTVENLQRWGIQSNTPYSSLTETDKDKDRKFADQIIGIIKDEIKQLIKGE